jgi:serine phosphatase RsbU (regulator of sigma subunit)
MEIQIAVAKTSKYAVSESGDTLEVVERPNGGVSIVLSDGQSSGRGAKVVSAMVVHKVISLLADGVRDGAAARAASDLLFTEKNGKVTATLNILSADFQTGTLVITCNNPTPIFISRQGKIDCLSLATQPIGSSRNIRPAISEFVLECGITVVMYTDGLVFAGDRYGQDLDICTLLDSLIEDQDPPPPTNRRYTSLTGHQVGPGPSERRHERGRAENCGSGNGPDPSDDGAAPRPSHQRFLLNTKVAQLPRQEVSGHG